MVALVIVAVAAVDVEVVVGAVLLVGVEVTEIASVAVSYFYSATSAAIAAIISRRC